MRKSKFEQSLDFTSECGVSCPFINPPLRTRSPGLWWWSGSGPRQDAPHRPLKGISTDGGPQQKRKREWRFLWKLHEQALVWFWFQRRHTSPVLRTVTCADLPADTGSTQAGESSPRRHTLLLPFAALRCPHPTLYLFISFGKRRKKWSENWNVGKWESNPNTEGDPAKSWKWRLRRLRRSR